MTDKQTREKLLAAGMCPGHPKLPIVEGFTMCQKCKDGNYVRYHAAKRKRMCVNHPQRPAAEGYIMCRECVDRLQSKYKAQKATGMCTNHITRPRPVVEGLTICQECRDREAKRYRVEIKTGMCRHHKGQPLLNGTTQCRLCREQSKASTARKRQKSDELKIKAFGGYSKDGVPRCACCGLKELDVLHGHHINGDGAEKRRNGVHGIHLSFYTWIVENEWPDEIEILCCNCHTSKRRNNGICGMNHKKQEHKNE